MGSKMSNTRLWAVIICVWYHDHEDGPIGDVTSKNHSYMNTITKGNSWQYRWSTLVDSGDKLASKNGIMTEIQRQAWPEEPIIKSSHRPRQWKEPSSCSNPQSDITSEEHLKISLRILSTLLSKITSLIHLSEYTLYVFVETHMFSVRTSTGRRNFRRSYYVLQRAGLNPHLPHTFAISDYRRLQIRHAQVHHYRCLTFRRVVWRATLDWRGRVVSSYP